MPSSKKAIFDNAPKRADKLQAERGVVDFQRILEFEPDAGARSCRRHSGAWCLVPFTTCSEPGRDSAGKYCPIWFGDGTDRRVGRQTDERSPSFRVMGLRRQAVTKP